MIFLRRFEVVSTDLAITKNCNRLLTERVVQLGRNAVKVNPAPPSIGDEELELNFCKALSLIRHKVKPDILEACHRLKKK